MVALVPAAMPVPGLNRSCTMSDSINASFAQTQVIKVSIDDLKPHPLEAGPRFPGPPSKAVRVLADRMAVEGQHYTIEILPDKTIVSDHDRVPGGDPSRWKELEATPWREGLADASDVAVEEYVLAARVNRPGCHFLEVAHDYKRLNEIGKHEWYEGQRQLDDLHPSQRRNVQDLMVEKLGKKGRSLSRWLAVLEAPVEVQDALIREEIKLVDAEAVGHRSTKGQGGDHQGRSGGRHRQGRHHGLFAEKGGETQVCRRCPCDTAAKPEARREGPGR